MSDCTATGFDIDEGIFFGITGLKLAAVAFAVFFGAATDAEAATGCF